MRSFTVFFTLSFLLLASPARAENPPTLKIPIDREWKKASVFSGNNIYYKVKVENGITLLHAEYQPSLKTVTLVRKLPSGLGNYDRIKFRWRVFKFPINSDEAVPGRMDDAASIYLFFRDGVKDYVLKYLFSAAHVKGFNFRDGDSSYFKKLHVIVLQDQHQETGKWYEEEIDFKQEFRKYFGVKDVPAIQGIGVLSDGDGTQSPVAADYADFELVDSAQTAPAKK